MTASTPIKCDDASINNNTSRSLLEMFHTPSFGDEDFEMSSILQQPATDNRCHTVSENQTITEKLASNASSLESQKRIDVPATEYSTRHSESQTFDVTTALRPKFPPQFFYIPDIQESNSVFSNDDKTVVSGHVSPVKSLNLHNSPEVKDEPISIPESRPSKPLLHSAYVREIPLHERLSIDSCHSDAHNLHCIPPNFAVATKPSPPKKAKSPKKRKKKDSNEPQKPVSAYALFFRETQALIKLQNPNASFGEMSKIVAAMWDTLDDERKNVYRKKTDMAKKIYLKQLATYRAGLIAQSSSISDDAKSDEMSSHSNSHAHQSAVPLLCHPLRTTPVSTVHQTQLPLQHQQQSRTPLKHMSHISPGITMMSVISSHQGAPLQYSTSPVPSHNPSHQVVARGFNNVDMPRELFSMMPGPTASMASSRASPIGRSMVRSSDVAWERDYANSESVITYCRDAFSSWMAIQQGNPTAGYAKLS